MTLEEELKAISGRKRQFLLLRIVSVDADAARKLCGITQGTYNSWMVNEEFHNLYQRKDTFAAEYRQEALRLIRRSNQLQAVLLEEKIIVKMKEEIESGVYILLKTNLAREVYSKLINDLDYQPKTLALSWEQRIIELSRGREVPQITGGESVDGEVISETDSEQETEHTKSQPLKNSQ